MMNKTKKQVIYGIIGKIFTEHAIYKIKNGFYKGISTLMIGMPSFSIRNYYERQFFCGSCLPQSSQVCGQFIFHELDDLQEAEVTVDLSAFQLRSGTYRLLKSEMTAEFTLIAK